MFSSVKKKMSKLLAVNKHKNKYKERLIEIHINYRAISNKCSIINRDL